jgi:hypothetical protein
MGNVLPSNKDIHQTFDLKGSMFGRITSDEEVKKNPHAVMKDQNWVKNKQQLQLGPAKRDILITQLERDVELLQSLNIMDYSLLIGIHDIIKGNTECIRDHRLHMVTVSSLFISISFHIFTLLFVISQKPRALKNKQHLKETNRIEQKLYVKHYEMQILNT